MSGEGCLQSQHLADLSDAEAEAIGRTVRRAASGLRKELGVNFVFSAIVGMSFAHFHQHVFVRHPGTPAQYDWMTGDRWAGAPRGPMTAVVKLCKRLRPYLEHDQPLADCYASSEATM
ncbi:hypothetical protein ACNTMW_23990 [Planosporangium sp. 12N6]|uniref:hypothetical protein n=1 Tax=Planosporangium spinosum TaxID=3402278 RepID=UPI003CE7A799